MRTLRPHPHTLFLKKRKKTTAEVTIGGKVWQIDPKRSYQATGVWTNPNPRSLTAAERERDPENPRIDPNIEKHRLMNLTRN